MQSKLCYGTEQWRNVYSFDEVAEVHLTLISASHLLMFMLLVLGYVYLGLTSCYCNLCICPDRRLEP